MSTIPHKVMFIWPPVQRFLIWAGARLGVFGLVINIWHIVQFEFHWLLTTLQACCLPNGSLWRNNCEIHAVSWLCYMFTLWPTCPILWYLRLWGTLPGLLTLKRCLSGKQLQEALARTGVNRTLSHASRPQIWGKKLGVHDRISAPKVNLVKKTVDKTGRTRVVTRAFVWLGGTLGSRIGVWCAKHIKHIHGVDTILYWRVSNFWLYVVSLWYPKSLNKHTSSSLLIQGWQQKSFVSECCLPATIWDDHRIIGSNSRLKACWANMSHWIFRWRWTWVFGRFKFG